MRSVQVIAGLEPEAGGPSYSVPALAAALVSRGLPVTLRYLSSSTVPAAANGAEGPPDAVPLDVHAHRPARDRLRRRLGISGDLAGALASDAAGGAVIHAHGLWLMPNIYPSRARRRSPAARLIHAPRGMLGPAALAISSWKKRPVWRLLQRAALAEADCLHATALSEYEEIRAAGLTNPVAIIPNGVDLPDLSGVPWAQGKEHVVLALGRVHPKKGLDRLLRAWRLVEPGLPEWRLRIVGPGERDHEKELRGLAQELGVRRVSIEGPVYGAQRLGLFRSAALFVLPTLNESFGLTVAEALAAELPVISTKGAPWAGLEGERCGWWVDHGVEALAAALTRAAALPTAERREMGARGRAWMARDFGWDRIGREMHHVYRWLKQGGEPPASVQLS